MARIHLSRSVIASHAAVFVAGVLLALFASQLGTQFIATHPAVIKQAEFLYVKSEEVAAEARRTGATPYDIKDVELGHHGPECNFDAFVHSTCWKRTRRLV